MGRSLGGGALVLLLQMLLFVLDSLNSLLLLQSLLDQSVTAQLKTRQLN